MSLVNLPVVTQMGLAAFKDKSVAEVLDEVEILYLNGQPRLAEEAGQRDNPRDSHHLYDRPD